MTANRSVGTGLTITAVISSWAWSTALLSSAVFGYRMWLCVAQSSQLQLSQDSKTAVYDCFPISQL